MAMRPFGTIEQKNGRLRARYNAPDGSRPSKSFPKNAKMQARAWLNSEHSTIIDGTWKSDAALKAERTAAEQSAVAEQFTLAEFAVEWLARMKRQNLKPKTIQTHRYRWQRHIEPEFGAMPVKSITEELINKWYDSLVDNTSQGVPRPVVMTFGTMLNLAVRLKRIDSNPMNLPGATKHRPVRRRTHDQKVASIHQVAKLSRAMPDHLAIAVPLAAWLGLREGEVLELRKSDFDLRAETVTPMRQVQFITAVGAVVTETKNEESDVEMAVPSVLLPQLRKHILEFSGPGDDGLLIPHPVNRDKHLHPNTFRAAFNRARDEVEGLDGFVFHDLRHTGLTLYARYGATPTEVMRRGRHKSYEVALGYQHAETMRDRDLTNRLSDDIEQSRSEVG